MGLGGIDVNIKSATLSRALGRDNDDSSLSKSESKSKSNEKTQSKPSSSNSNNPNVGLDLSGQFHVHLSSPSEHEGNYLQTSEPLFQWGQTSSHPSVHVGAHYNFYRCWFGVTRLLSTFSWLRSDRNNKMLQVTSEVGCLEPHDYSLQISASNAQVETYDDSSNRISVRLDTLHPKGTFSVQKPIFHRRLNLVWSITALLGAQNHPSSNYNNKLPPLYAQDPDSILPSFQLGTTGRLSSTSCIGWTTNKRHSKSHKSSSSRLPKLNLGIQNCFSRMGVRLVVSKQLDWNPFGSLDHDDDTTVRVELLGVENSENDILDCISIQSCGTSIQDFKDTARITLSRDQQIRVMKK